ncbi:MAG TPA: hypothetical protein VFB21_01515 [Chthonomonadaceae bacterium]|nr:hypothetical protein [Chthonomonadaceae bacterium]
MSDLRTIVERISGPDAIRRVERDESAQNFGQRHRDRNSGGKRPPQQEAEDESPQDVVEVSADYHPAHLPPPLVPPASPSLLPARRARASNAKGADAAPSPAPTERHIDIQV